MADNSYGIWIISFLLVGILGMAFLTTINDAISTTTTPTSVSGETLANYGENTVTNTPLHAVTSVYRSPTLTAYTDYIVTLASNLINLNTTQADTLELVAPHAEAAGYWSFNVNNSTNTIDDANGLNNGTVIDAIWSNVDCAYGNGCFEFDGNTAYINVSNAQNLDGTSELSISAWFNAINIPSGFGAIISKDTNINRSWKLLVMSSGKVSIGFKNSSENSTSVTSPEDSWIPGTWHHIVGTYDGVTTTLYFDGTQVGTPSTAISGNLIDSEDPVRIGQYYNANYFNGTIDEPRIYNRSLSANEIKEIYDTYMNTSVYKADYTYKQSSYVEGTSSSLLWLIPTFLLLSLLVLFWRLADQGA